MHVGLRERGRGALYSRCIALWLYNAGIRVLLLFTIFRRSVKFRRPIIVTDVPFFLLKKNLSSLTNNKNACDLLWNNAHIYDKQHVSLHRK